MTTQARGGVPAPTGNLQSVDSIDNTQQIAGAAIPLSLFSSPSSENTGADSVEASTCTWCKAVGPLAAFVVALYLIDRFM